jgi:hypothetical protein
VVVVPPEGLDFWSGVEYLDLSPYEYGEFPLPMRSVGWLGPTYGLQGADAAVIAAADLERLEAASWLVVSQKLGFHDCEFCPEDSAFERNGEYHYYARGGDVYSAPVMVLHYAKEHGYRPPEVFLECLRESGGLDWDWRAARLSSVLLDKSQDLGLRCEAIMDLANWRDRRAMDALLGAVEDEELLDVAGDEIGRALGHLLSCEFASELRVEELPDFVRVGIGRVSQQ